MAIGHIDSYYASRLGAVAGYPKLDGHRKTSVCVVGGGLAGLTTARELAEAGRETIVLEAERVGWGASGRNGGFVSAGYAAGIDTLEDKLGVDHTKELYRLSQQGVGYVRDTITKGGASEIIGGHGKLKALRYDDGATLLRRSEKLRSVYNIDVEYWDTHKLRSQLISNSYFHALYDPVPFHIDPLAYTNLLAGAAIAEGAIIFEHTPARALKRFGNAWRIATPAGSVEAETVVLAGSAYQALDHLWPPLDRAVLPVATYVMTSEALGEALNDSIKFAGCIADSRRAGDYYRVVGGDRLLWGGRITTRRSEPAELASMLKADIVAIYPRLNDLKVGHAWSGLMGYAIHKMPIIRPLQTGLWAATAFGGHGLGATAAAGMLVASAIADNDDQWRLFDVFGAQWGGGLFGRAFTQLAYWGMQFRDKLEERAGS